MLRPFALVFAAATLFYACGSDDAATSDAISAPACNAGDKSDCTCSGNTKGTQTCQADGTYSTCNCGAAGKAGAGGSAGKSGSSGSSSGQGGAGGSSGSGGTGNAGGVAGKGGSSGSGGSSGASSVFGGGGQNSAGDPFGGGGSSGSGGGSSGGNSSSGSGGTSSGGNGSGGSSGGSSGAVGPCPDGSCAGPNQCCRNPGPPAECGQAVGGLICLLSAHNLRRASSIWARASSTEAASAVRCPIFRPALGSVLP